jgi:predicted acyltransferase
MSQCNFLTNNHFMSQTTSPRYYSLDVFRGLTIALMIIVNTPGSWAYVYPPLDHARWHGCTPTDWVFPSFMFAIGVSMRFSFKPFDYTLSSALAWKIIKRTLMIYALYIVFMQLFPFYWHDKSGAFHWGRNWETFRPMGVLPRLALGYCCAAFICLTAPQRWLPYIGGGMLLAYWAIMYGFGDAGNPYGTLPTIQQFVGMSEEAISHFWQTQMTSNAAFKLDNFLLGKHVYHGEGYAFEPEGVLSTLPSIVTVMLGYMTGTYIQTTENKEKLIKNIITAGGVLIATSLLWDLVFPINKKLWTSSYVLHMAGIDMLVLGILIYVVDVAGKTGWTFFFKVFGANAILAYLISEVPIIASFRIQLHETAEKTTSLYGWLYKHWFASWAGAMNGSFFFALWWMLTCWVICWVLYKRGLFLKV